jgi:hypothetical protein
MAERSSIKIRNKLDCPIFGTIFALKGKFYGATRAFYYAFGRGVSSNGGRIASEEKAY